MDTAPKWPKCDKNDGTFSSVAGRNFNETGWEGSQIIPSVQDSFVLNFSQVAPYLHIGCRRTGRCRKMGWNYIVLSSKI